jgi:hypothetical protein
MEIHLRLKGKLTLTLVIEPDAVRLLSEGLPSPPSLTPYSLEGS